MGDAMMTALEQLLRASLAQWQLHGDVQGDDDTITLGHGDSTLSIGRAPDGMPFRWVVQVDSRRRTAASVNGVLRIVRQTLAPGYEPLSLRIAPLPAMPSPPQDAP
ncbi:MAG: hypothetical protein ACR2PI_22845 [Hyphomicrobiaceae bacterium]